MHMQNNTMVCQAEYIKCGCELVFLLRSRNSVFNNIERKVFHLKKKKMLYLIALFTIQNFLTDELPVNKLGKP